MRLTRLLLTLSLTTALAGCDTVFGPASEPMSPARDPVSLRISGPPLATARPGTSDTGAPRLECAVTLTAELTSENSAARARWAGATARWYEISTGALAQTKELTATEVGQMWGAAEITPGDPQWSQLTFWEQEPFRLSIDFRYRVGAGGAPQTVSYWLRCEQTAP